MLWVAAPAVVFAALFGQARGAFAAGSSDPSGVIAEADWIVTRQVLVIPQQCSREAVSALCDRSDAAAADFAVRRSGPGSPANKRSASRARRGFEYGTLADYEHQRPADATVPVAPGCVTIPPAIAVQPREGGAGASGSRARAPAPLAPARHP
jgi:hypothetical protein